MWKRHRAADLVELLDDVLRRVGNPVKRRHLVERARKPTLGAHAVVAGDINDDGVVEHSDIFKTVEQSANFMISVFTKSGVVLHQARGDALLVGAELIPVLDARRPGS